MSLGSHAKQNKTGPFSLSRRAFLKLSALGGTAAVISRFFSHLPVLGRALTPAVIEEGVVTESWIPTSCLNCATRCGTRVRVVNGKAVKITGNPLSRVSEGENCPRVHVGLQVLYDPDRMTRPLKRTNPAKGRGVDPGWVPVSWPDALSEVSQRLKTLRDGNQPHQLLLLHGLNSRSDEDIIGRFAEAYGTPNVVSEDGFDSEADKAGQWLADGNYTQSAYDLENTNYILAFGASILESQKPLARNLRMWGKIHRERPNRVKVVVVDPRYSVTAAKSDRWLPINPGTDAALAMSLASVIIDEGLYDADFIAGWTTGFEEYRSLALSHYYPERAAYFTGIAAETIREIAREFATSRPAIAWRGRGATSRPHGAYAAYAIFCLNALVGSIDTPGGVTYQENPPYRPMPAVVEDTVSRRGKAQPALDRRHSGEFPAARVVSNQAADSLLAGSPYPAQMAIGFNCNFNMSAPGTRRWDEALARIPYYVHVTPFASEMAEYADILLPAPTFLETWAYDHAPPGSGFAEIKIKQPVVAPQADTKSTIDILMEIARGLGGTVAESFRGIGDDAEGFVRYRTETLQPWDAFREKGVWVGPAYRFYKYDAIFKTPSRKFEFVSGNLEARLKDSGERYEPTALLPHFAEPEFLGDSQSYPLVLTTYQPVLNVENGSQNYPWAQEFFLVMHGRGWQNFLEINSATAAGLGIGDGDPVWVESPFGKIKLKARVFEGIHPQVVSIAVGQGHYNNGRWADGIGANPNEIIGVDYDRLSGQSALFNTRVNVYRA